MQVAQAAFALAHTLQIGAEELQSHFLRVRLQAAATQAIDCGLIMTGSPARSAH